MATRMGLEPTTSAVTGRRSNQLNYRARSGTFKSPLGGNNRARTYDPLLVRQMLSQLSYAPKSPLRFSTAIFIIQHKNLFVKSFLEIFQNIFFMTSFSRFRPRKRPCFRHRQAFVLLRENRCPTYRKLVPRPFRLLVLVVFHAALFSSAFFPCAF